MSGLAAGDDARMVLRAQVCTPLRDKNMANPVLVEVTRGDARREPPPRRRRRSATPTGRRLCAIGEVEAPVFPRSAVKAMQALPLVESGAADAFGFRAARACAGAGLAWRRAGACGGRRRACSRRSGSARRISNAARTCRATALRRAALIREGREPSQLHNNCSGKHANFLAVARHLGIDHRGYVGAAASGAGDDARGAWRALTGAAHDADAMRHGRLLDPDLRHPARGARARLRALRNGRRPAAGARRRRRGASTTPRCAEPFFVAGTGRFCTDAMQLLGGAALLKTGAEGVFCAAIPALGLGVALKCDDGATRASEAMMAAVLARLFPEHEAALRRWSHAPVSRGATRRRGSQGGRGGFRLVGWAKRRGACPRGTRGRWHAAFRGFAHLRDAVPLDGEVRPCFRAARRPGRRSPPPPSACRGSRLARRRRSGCRR